MGVRAKNNVGSPLKKTIISVDVANEGDFFNFYKQNDVDVIMSQLGKGRNCFFFPFLIKLLLKS